LIHRVGPELQLPPGGSILELVELKLQLELSMDRVTQQVPQSARWRIYIYIYIQVLRNIRHRAGARVSVVLLFGGSAFRRFGSSAVQRLGGSIGGSALRRFGDWRFGGSVVWVFGGSGWAFKIELKRSKGL
jgi:hypothetical protein